MPALTRPRALCHQVDESFLLFCDRVEERCGNCFPVVVKLTQRRLPVVVLLSCPMVWLSCVYVPVWGGKQGFSFVSLAMPQYSFVALLCVAAVAAMVHCQFPLALQSGSNGPHSGSGSNMPPSSGSGSSGSSGAPSDAQQYWLASWDNTIVCDQDGENPASNVTHLTGVCHNIQLPGGVWLSFNVTQCSYPSDFSLDTWKGKGCQGETSSSAGFSNGGCLSNLFTSVDVKDHSWELFCMPPS
jgi:hypothetical protein